MNMIKTIYQTTIHLALAAMVFFYASPDYGVVHYQHHQANNQDGNALNAFLDSKMGSK